MITVQKDAPAEAQNCSAPQRCTAAAQFSREHRRALMQGDIMRSAAAKLMPDRPVFDAGAFTGRVTDGGGFVSDGDLAPADAPAFVAWVVRTFT